MPDITFAYRRSSFFFESPSSRHQYLNTSTPLISSKSALHSELLCDSTLGPYKDHFSVVWLRLAAAVTSHDIYKFLAAVSWPLHFSPDARQAHHSGSELLEPRCCFCITKVTYGRCMIGKLCCSECGIRRRRTKLSRSFAIGLSVQLPAN